MRRLSLRPRPDNQSEAKSLAFLRQLAADQDLSLQHACFIISVARQYQSAGLAWQELLAAGYAGFRQGHSPVTDPTARHRQARFGLCRVRQRMLQAIAEKR
jgi:DNA-directed RNA polymerase sigma subunit (sigma70/sigma32)